MCVILSIYQKKPKADLALIQKINDLAISNSDGVGITAFNYENGASPLTLRKMDINQVNLQKIMEEYQIINIHLRNATAGKTKKANVHFWKWNDWTFAHNGMVSNYENFKEKGDNFRTDSYVLFRKMIREGVFTKKNTLNYQKMDKALKDVNFWGRFVITNVKTKKIFYFGDFKGILLNQNCLVISTTSLNFGMVYNMLGIEFENDIKPFLETDLEGIFWFSPKKRKIFWQSKNFNAYSYGDTSYYVGEENKSGFKQITKEELEEEEYWEKEEKKFKLTEEKLEKEREAEKEKVNEEVKKAIAAATEPKPKYPFPVGQRFLIQ